VSDDQPEEAAGGSTGDGTDITDRDEDRPGTDDTPGDGTGTTDPADHTPGDGTGTTDPADDGTGTATAPARPAYDVGGTTGEPGGTSRDPARPAPRRLRAAVLAVVALVATVGAVATVRQPPPRPDGLVILYGDSLATEASGAFVDELARTSDAEVVTRPVPGASPCDGLATMQDDLARRPTVVVIQYVGNSSSACSRGPDGQPLGEQEHIDRTVADVRAATELFATRGTRVVLVGGPDVPGLPGNPGRALADAYNRIVNEWAGRDLGRVRYADAAATVSGPDHAYADRRPCRDDEGEAQGCAGGEVVVRGPDRIHFCPQPDATLVCPVPSPGARRFGVEMARVARLALDPDY